MSQLYERPIDRLEYYDREAGMDYSVMLEKTRNSSTLYVGNLVDLNEAQLYTIFGRYGRLKRVIIGVSEEGEFSGFCFVEYETRAEAEGAKRALDRTPLNGKYIRIDWDYGYEKGREIARRKHFPADGRPNRRRYDGRRDERAYTDRYSSRRRTADNDDDDDNFLPARRSHNRS